jgi:transcriptional regulator with XRE-family HTH domain
MLGTRLRQARERSKFSQRQLSELLGLGDNEIYRYENEITSPSANTLRLLARGLGVSADWLLGITDDESVNRVLTWRQEQIVELLNKGEKLKAIQLIVEDER